MGLALGVQIRFSFRDIAAGLLVVLSVSGGIGQAIDVNWRRGAEPTGVGSDEKNS
jgi:hypothetical protein